MNATPTTASTAGPATVCPYCGTNAHVGYRCPTVKAIEYHTDGSIKRVEFFGSADYSPNGIYPLVSYKYCSCGGVV